MQPYVHKFQLTCAISGLLNYHFCSSFLFHEKIVNSGNCQEHQQAYSCHNIYIQFLILHLIKINNFDQYKYFKMEMNAIRIDLQCRICLVFQQSEEDMTSLFEMMEGDFALSDILKNISNIEVTSTFMLSKQHNLEL